MVNSPSICRLEATSLAWRSGSRLRYCGSIPVPTLSHGACGAPKERSAGLTFCAALSYLLIFISGFSRPVPVFARRLGFLQESG
jgi:hypothetical protein